MTLAPEAQVVLISAVIGNAPVIAEWLIGDANAVISGEGLLPTTKSIAFASWQRERGLLQYVSPDDPEQQEFFVPRIVTQTNLALRRGERAPRIFPKRSGTGASAEIGLYLGLHLAEGGSVALFCGTKEGVISLCGRAAAIFDRAVALPRPLDVSNAAEIARLTHLARLNLRRRQDVTQASALGNSCSSRQHAPGAAPVRRTCHEGRACKVCHLHLDPGARCQFPNPVPYRLGNPAG